MDSATDVSTPGELGATQDSFTRTLEILKLKAQLEDRVPQQSETEDELKAASGAPSLVDHLSDLDRTATILLSATADDLFPVDPPKWPFLQMPDKLRHLQIKQLTTHRLMITEQKTAKRKSSKGLKW